MSKIREIFEDKKGFVGFVTAGDPSLEKTEEFILEMANAGASLIEIGIPFSDPIAEGNSIQEANVRALSVEGGCTTDMIFEMVERVSKKVSVPLVFRTYANPVFKYGYERFFSRCSQCGVKGIAIPDMRYAEQGEVAPYSEKYGVTILSEVKPASAIVKIIAKYGSEAATYVREYVQSKVTASAY